MSAVAEMDIVIGAEVSGAVNGLKQVQTGLNKTEQTATKAAAAFGKVSKSSSTADQSLINLGRVAQDLPFGFIAISNNLNPLIEGFQRLQVEAKSTGTKVLPLLLKSLSGGGGIGLALSAVTAAISFVNVGFSAWTRGLTSHKTAVDNDTKSINENQEAINQSYKAAGAQFAQVAKLIEQSKLQATTHEQQNKILEDLKGISQEYFGTLQVEGKAIDGLNAAYELYGNNILKVARAKGAAASIEKLTSDLLATKDATLSLDNNFTNLNLTFEKAGKFIKGQTGGNAFEVIANASKRVTDILAKGLPTFEDIAFLSAATGLSEAKINLILSDRQKLKTKEAQLTAQIASNSKLIAANEISSIQGIKDKIEKIKEFKIARVPFDIKAGRVTPLQDHSFDTINKEIGDFLAKHPLKPVVTLQPKLILGEQAKAAIAATLGLINEQIKSGFYAIGESLGNALAGAKNPFAPILAVLAEGLKTLGKAYIEIGVEALITKKALLLLMKSPVLTIAAGIALVALGSLLQNKANNVKAFATGGVVTKPTLALVGEQGPERITPLGYEGRANNMMQGEVVFQISGQSLRGILKRADQTAFNTF